MPRPHEFNDASRGPRLQKVLAEAGVGSRRACETMIEAGEVTVNGQRVDSLPAWVDPARDHIAVRGRKLRFTSENVFVMLFKPRGTITTNADDHDRRRVIDLVDHPSGARLYPVGRLDIDSSGLILLTNNGDFANKLTHPRHGISKVYELTVEGNISDEQLQTIERGVYMRDRRSGRNVKTTRASLEVIQRDHDSTQLRMELNEGRHPQIRDLMLTVGHPVKKLRRVQLGPLKLTGLQPGQWRDLTPQELSALRRAVDSPSSKSASAPAKKRRAAAMRSKPEATSRPSRAESNADSSKRNATPRFRSKGSKPAKKAPQRGRRSAGRSTRPR